MKSNFEILAEYFGKKYNRKNKWDRYKYVADELGVTSRTVWNAIHQKTKNQSLAKLAEKTVNELRQIGQL